MSASILILSKIPNLGKELRIIAPTLKFIEIIETENVTLPKSEVIIADLDLLIPHLSNIAETKWIQSTWAGVDKFLPYFTSENFNSTIITRFSGKHFGRLMSEYVVANIVNYERNFFEIYENKKQKIWLQNGKISQHRSIADLTIGILGIGNIGNYIAKILHNFGATLWGFGRRNQISNNENYKHFEQYCNSDNLLKLLCNCDYIVNVLPSTTETAGLLNGNILQHCAKKQPVLINIGRGNIINEKDLLEALTKKWLSAAILDVFENEPLINKSALWDCNQVFITPHVAGVSRARDLAEQFMENMKLYQNNQEIPNQLKVGNKY